MLGGLSDLFPCHPYCRSFSRHGPADAALIDTTSVNRSGICGYALSPGGVDGFSYLVGLCHPVTGIVVGSFLWLANIQATANASGMATAPISQDFAFQTGQYCRLIYDSLQTESGSNTPFTHPATNEVSGIRLPVALFLQGPAPCRVSIYPYPCIQGLYAPSPI